MLALLQAGGSDGSPESGADVGSACEAVLSLVQALNEARIPSVLDFMPGQIIEDWDEGYTDGLNDVQQDGPLRLKETLALVGELTDSYAQRALLFGAPRKVEPLSSLLTARDKFHQRLAVTSHSGEDLVLTARMVLEERLEARYKSCKVSEGWVLSGFVGEPADIEIPTAPSPIHPPEAIVAAQLEALRLGDVATVFSFASPTNQAATGPVERFAEMIRSPMYSTLLGHKNAKVLRAVQQSRERLIATVGVNAEREGKPVSAVFQWIVGLQTDGMRSGCWMTEAVRVTAFGSSAF